MWQPKRWTAAHLAERRLDGVRLLRTGRLSQAELARRMGVSRAAVTPWQQRFPVAGLRGVQRRPTPGRPTRLSPGQWRPLVGLLRRGARATGFETERWTLRRVAALIERPFGVRYHFRSLGRALGGRGWRPHQPIPRARDRDAALVEAWLRRDWPRIQRGRAARGAPSSAWTRRGTHCGPTSAPPGHRSAGPPS